MPLLPLPPNTTSSLEAVTVSRRKNEQTNVRLLVLTLDATYCISSGGGESRWIAVKSSASIISPISNDYERNRNATNQNCWTGPQKCCCPQLVLLLLLSVAQWDPRIRRRRWRPSSDDEQWTTGLVAFFLVFTDYFHHSFDKVPYKSRGLYSSNKWWQTVSLFERLSIIIIIWQSRFLFCSVLASCWREQRSLQSWKIVRQDYYEER